MRHRNREENQTVAIATLLVAIVIALMGIIEGCATFQKSDPAYHAATVQWKTDSANYRRAGDALHSNPAALKRVTPWQTFTNYQMAEIPAADHVEQSFADWLASGQKPVNFDDLYATAKAAQQKVIDLATQAGVYKP